MSENNNTDGVKLNLDTSTIRYFTNELAGLEQVEVKGETYWVGAGQIVPTPLPLVTPRNLPEPLVLSSLSGLARYVFSNIDELDHGTHLIECSPALARLLGPLDSLHRTRETVAIAKFNPPRPFSSDWYPLHEALGRVATLFEQTEALQELIKRLSRVEMKGTRVQSLEGLGWKASAEAGVTADGWEEVTSPIFELHPIRSFPEIAQAPVKYFVEVRATGEGEEAVAQLRLREVADGKWVAIAAERVAVRLSEALGSLFGYDTPRAPAVIW